MTLAAFGLLYWLLDRVGWAAVGQAFARVGIVGAAVLFVLGIVENLLDAAALSASLPPERRVGVLKTLSFTSVGVIVNLFIPWEAGEVVKAGLLGRHVTARHAIPSMVIWNYVFKLSRPIVTMLAVLIGVLFARSIPRGAAFLLVMAAAVSFLPYFVLKLALGWGVTRWTLALLHRLRLLRGDPEGARRTALAVDNTIRDFYRERPGDYFRVLFYQMGARVASWATWGAAGWILGQRYDFATMAAMYGAVSLASLVALASPFKIGVGELLAGGSFGLIGLDPATGVLIALIMRIKTIATSGASSVFLGGK